MPRKNLLTLHEAMILALASNPQRTLSFDAIADFIEQRGLFTEREGNIPLATQVKLRAFLSSQKYMHLFEKMDDNTIRLRNI